MNITACYPVTEQYNEIIFLCPPFLILRNPRENDLLVRVYQNVLELTSDRLWSVVTKAATTLRFRTRGSNF